ncbi:MAG: hypothetical protein IJL53_09690 [Firmicutes bacterium]|nr:hypothetical protein [Bacillota bacterium]
MEWLVILIILAVVAIIVVAGISGANKTKELLASGKIIQRPYGFHEQQETFSVHGADITRIIEDIKNSDLGGASATKVEGKQLIVFKHATGWTAQLYKAKDPEEGPAEPDLTTWIFNFTHWKKDNSMVAGLQQMNILTTSIEKMFLAIDPKTQVTTSQMAVKTTTKTKFF